ncbi:MAG TPA: hypothetical protein VGA77_12845 [Propylenella sp.]
MPHKFKIGQRVHLSASGLNRHVGGIYKVLAQLPEERGDRQYKVENIAGTQQRVVWESQLRGLDPV